MDDTENIQADAQHLAVMARVAGQIDWREAPSWANYLQVGTPSNWWLDSKKNPEKMEPAPRYGVIDAEASLLPAYLHTIQRPLQTVPELTGIADDPKRMVALRLGPFITDESKRPGENPHSGDITGYRQMACGDVAMINGIKAAEIELAKLWQEVAARADIDARWLNIARTEFEQGFMALVRAVARPTPRFGHL
jgi:hypothetical protein